MILIIGVSGSGKTTVAKLLSKAIDKRFFDADDFHSQDNINKMKRGMALNDQDRSSWLNTLANKMEKWESEDGAILACSALKEKYRRILSSKTNNIFWVYLSGSYDVINSRMSKRKDHYMSADLLQSQFDALEIPEYGLHINIELAPQEIVNIIKSEL